MNKQQVKAAIVNIGDELLIGQIVNTNANVIAQMLNTLGIEITEIVVIADAQDAILRTFEQKISQNDIVFVTGGLGTTNDDITKKCICLYYHTSLIENAIVKKHIQDIRKSRGLSIPDSVLSQAMVPQISEVITNPIGTAPGMWIHQNQKVLISTPGVPGELLAMLEEIRLRLQQTFLPWNKIDRHFKISNISESGLSDMLQEFEQGLPDYISLAYLPKYGIINLRLSGRHADKQLLEQEMNRQCALLQNIAKDYIFCDQNIEMAQLVGQVLKQQHKTMATAESCTGGLIAHEITRYAGSSAYFKGSVIAYSNEIKQHILHVPADTLNTQGAVSEDTVKYMAENLLSLYNVDYSVAVSGIAGPDGGNEQHPVGTVWIAVADKNKCVTKLHHLGFGRQRVMDRTCQLALLMLYQLIQDK
ncbi:MAG: CinA family nicotinamide mononucleotide deamidase-related protein [Bacteroidales bacterium]|nr:CinA family nicotinamide mononucleotide deamidase-related protein [Bacteroidales bacterium]